MTVTEESRHRLHQTLDRTIGPEDATTLMEHLPPVGWADVATKQDLAQLEHRIDLRFERLEAHIDGRFAVGDERFRSIDQRLEERFDAIDRRFDAIDRQFEAIDRRFEAIDRRFEAVDRRFDAMDARFESMERRLDAIDSKLGYQFWQFLGLMVAIWAGVLATLGLLGVG